MFFYEKYSSLLLMGLLSCASFSDSLISVTTSTNEILVSKIVSDFAVKFIRNQTTFISMMSASSSPEHDLLHKDIIRNVIMLNEATFTYQIIDYKMHFAKRHTFYLLLIESYKDFVKILSNINRESLRTKPPAYYFTIVTSVYSDPDEFLNNLFEASYAKSILHINFLSPRPHRNPAAWLMTTFMPFVKSCNALQQYDVAVLTEQNYSLHGPIDVIYPKKLENFRQCPVVVAVFHTPPFMIIKSETNERTYDGIDTRILGNLAKKLNFKLIYRMPRDTQDRGTINSNGTVTGCIKMVVDREANLTVGAYMRTLLRSHYMMPSESYIQVALGFAVLQSDDISSTLSKLLAPFTAHLWQSTSLCVLIAVTIIAMTKKLSRRWRHFVIGGYLNSTPILNMWSTFLGAGIGNPRFAKARYSSMFARSLLMIWLMSCLILRGSYQGALYNFLQREILSSPFDTISKINESDCNLLVMNTATSSLDKFHFSRSRHLVYNYSQQTVFRQVYDRELSGAVYCNDLQMKYFNLLNSPRRVLQMTKDRLFLMSVVIYFNNVSVLQPIFDDELLKLTDSGLIGYWTRKFTDQRSESQSQSYNQRIPKRLRLQNLFAIFEISIGLLIICFLVFVLEKVGLRFEWLKNVIESVTY